MNYHCEALEEHDESVKKALSNIDQETLAETKEILNSKEFKKSRRKAANQIKFNKVLLFSKKWFAENWIDFITLIATLITLYLTITKQL